MVFNKNSYLKLVSWNNFNLGIYRLWLISYVMVFKFNKTEKPFGGVVEWFKALVLKTIFLGRKEIYKLSIIGWYNFNLKGKTISIKYPYRDKVATLSR